MSDPRFETYRTARIAHFHNDAASHGAYANAAFEAEISKKKAEEIRAYIADWPGYAPTPLRRLDALAREIGVASLLYKDESARFDLKSFKALGGAYAVDELLVREIAKRRPGEAVTLQSLLDDAYSEDCKSITITTATDGNHGRSVAWGARRRGCRCVIYIHAGVSQGREAALASFGADVVRIAGNYDNSVHQAAADAKANGWFVVSDTSYEGYIDPPRDVMRGYTVMTAETIAQMADDLPPTHVFIQGGVGGLAAAVIGYYWDVYQDHRPRFVVVEPENADCLYQSAIAGAPMVVHGDLDTIMAGLSCGEVSMLAWPIIEQAADDFIAISDETVPNAMRLLANGFYTDGGIEAGESAVAGLCAVISVMKKPPLAKAVGLGADSRILLFGTEGATDPEIYQRIVS